jgi:hypothetical protein
VDITRVYDFGQCSVKYSFSVCWSWFRVSVEGGNTFLLSLLTSRSEVLF